MKEVETGKVNTIAVFSILEKIPYLWSALQWRIQDCSKRGGGRGREGDTTHSLFTKICELACWIRPCFEITAKGTHLGLESRAVENHEDVAIVLRLLNAFDLCTGFSSLSTFTCFTGVRAACLYKRMKFRLESKLRKESH